MSYEAYKALQREQEQLLKAYKRGRVVHVSSRLEKLQTADGRELIARRNHTYKKPPTP
jgi:hypothetical protein